MKIEYEFMFPIKVRIEKLKLLIEALQKERNLILICNALKEMNDESRITINNIGALLDNYKLEKSRLEIAYEYYNNHLK